MTAKPKPRVLFVDDEPLVLQGLKLHLRERFDVYTATSGPEGLKLIEETEGGFVVIVSDMRMPEMNGAEFLRLAREAAPETTRILLTGYADTDTAIQAVNTGRIFRFLTKPIRPPDLIAAVVDAVNEHQRQTLDRSLLRKEASRVSQRIIQAQRLAQIGELAKSSGNELSNLASIHQSMVESITSRAQTGAFVTVEDLADLRWIEESLKRHAEQLNDFEELDTKEPTFVDLRDTVARTLELLQVMGTLKHIRIDFDFGEEVGPVHGAPGRLQHAVLNLIVNAIDAVSSRDPSSARIDIAVRRRRTDHAVVFEVTDNGGGVHPESAPFIMKPYFTTKPEASGLGLSVASQIVSSYGGTVEFDSKFGKGSTFRIVLPAAGTADTVEGRRPGTLDEHHLEGGD